MNFNKVLVEPDSPEFLEDQVRYDKDVFDFRKINIPMFGARYREKQRNYYTSPIDILGKRLRFYPGGYTIWSGEPGSGKTTILRQLATYYLHKQQGVFVCSLEELPEDVFMRHVCTAVGNDNPSDNAIQWCIDSWEEHLKIWNYSARDSDAEHAKIFAGVRVLARDHGIKHAIIDNLFSMDVGMDLNSQGQFAKKLIRTCTISGVHLHLVAHPRKKQRSDTERSLDDIAGIADLNRAVDNIEWVKRKDAKDEKQDAESTGVCIETMKQRWHPSWRGNIVGWYNRKFRQFFPDDEQFPEAPQHYLPADAYIDPFHSEPLFPPGG